MRIIIIALLALFIVSCNKNKEYCWECVHNTNEKGKTNTKFTDTVEVCNKTKSEIKDYEKFNEDAWNLKHPTSPWEVIVTCDKK